VAAALAVKISRKGGRYRKEREGRRKGKRLSERVTGEAAQSLRQKYKEGEG